MSRIRSIHPGLWTDDAFMALSAHARLLVIGLWTESFDDGVFDWKPLTLKARIFPADNVDISALLDELVAGAFTRQEEFNGRKIGLVRNFREYQRPKKPNSSGALRPEWETYVGITAPDAEPVPDQSPTITENSPQMEDGGGKREDEETKTPAVSSAFGGRDLFDDIWETFPHNPSSSEASALTAFNSLGMADRAGLLKAARHYAAWFAEECVARKRTPDAGKRFVPKLETWITSNAWREAGELRLKADGSAPVVAMIRLDRERDHDLWLECERIIGKPAPTSGMVWSFLTEVVDKARATLGAAA